MTTLVGMQKNYVEYLKKLSELEYDAIEAYNLAINKLDSKAYKMQLQAFMEDHEKHIKDLGQILAAHDEGVTCPDTKQWLVKMMVGLGNLLNSDAGILRAMSYVESDTNIAYERYTNYQHIEETDKRLLQQFLLDERRHKSWIDTTLKAIGT